jgi:hypothetical protein
LFETGSKARSNYDIQREKAYCEISYLEGYLDKHWKQTGADSAHIKGDKRMFEEYKQKNYGKYTEGLAGLYYIAWFAQNIFAQILLGSGPDRTYWPIDKYDTPFGDYCSNRCKNDYRCQ